MGGPLRDVVRRGALELFGHGALHQGGEDYHLLTTTVIVLLVELLLPASARMPSRSTSSIDAAPGPVGRWTVPESVQTGWVVPPSPITGLDHLGVQAPCIALYGQLLPGITNVTERARYYSFYPWVIWSFEKRYTDLSQKSFCRVLRRAECLLALVAAYHETVLDEVDREHGTATVGRVKLRGPGVAAVEGTVTDIEPYAALEGESRYFKNHLGGLGQYYFGPLRDLQVLDYVDGDRHKPPGYDRTRGVALAQAFDAGVPGDRFFELLEEGSVGGHELAELAAFCPCGLKRNDAERNLLVDLFLARNGEWGRDGGPERRASLTLLLDLVARHPESPEVGLEGLLRAASYSRALADGSDWTVDQGCRRSRDGWGTYARNEILSVALQGLFWAQLRAVEELDSPLRTTEQAGELLRNLVLSALGVDWSGLTVAGAVDRVRGALPSVSDWSSNEHEIRRAWAMEQLARKGESPATVARESTLLLLSLLARGIHEHPYEDFDLEPAYFSSEDIHLVALRRWSAEWESWSLGDWVAWLGHRWCIERHLRVALRKLRGESRDTFRIRPLDNTFAVVEVPPVVFTSPRMRCAEQILRDLGLLVARDDWYELSDAGRAVLEEHRHG